VRLSHLDIDEAGGCEPLLEFGPPRCSPSTAPCRAASGSSMSGSATTSVKARRPPGRRTRAASRSTRAFSSERLMTQLEREHTARIRRDASPFGVSGTSSAGYAPATGQTREDRGRFTALHRVTGTVAARDRGRSPRSPWRSRRDPVGALRLRLDAGDVQDPSGWILPKNSRWSPGVRADQDRPRRASEKMIEVGLAKRAEARTTGSSSRSEHRGGCWVDPGD